MTGRDDVRAHVARSLDAPLELVPYLPQLLIDLEELGVEVTDIVDVVRPLDLPVDTRVLDLGCGKGAVALALADIFGFQVKGVDATWEFVEHANRKVYRMGLDDRCRFETGDVRDEAELARNYGMVCLLSLGPVFGDPARTVEALRHCVAPGGYIFIDDGYLRDADDRIIGYEAYYDHDTTLRLLQSRGDRLVQERPTDPLRLRAWNERATAAIIRRAEELAKRHPELRRDLETYVENQRLETEHLTGPLVPTLWILERA